MKSLALASRLPRTFLSLIEFIVKPVSGVRSGEEIRKYLVAIIFAAIVITATAPQTSAALWRDASISQTLELLGAGRHFSVLAPQSSADRAFFAVPYERALGGRGNFFQATDCFLLFSSTVQNVSSSAGTGGFAFTTTDPACQVSWSASTNTPWISIINSSGTAVGTFPSSITFNVSQNTTGQPRSGTITVSAGINVYILTVNQGIPCSFSLSASAANFPASGGSGDFMVVTGTGCVWTAQSNDSWIIVTAGANGSGNGTVSYSVQANNGPARTGTISAGGKIFTITQANGCTYTLTPTGANFSAGGGAGSFNVTTGLGCTWTAASNDPWINVTSGASGSGNGSVSYNVDANTGPARNGSITAGGQTFTIGQASGCTFLLAPTNSSISAGGGNGSFNVTTAAGCTWTAVSNSSWINVTSGANGNGAGTVSYSVQANNGPARTGTITAGGQTFTVDQENGCTFSLSPTSASFSANGGSGSFNVTTGAGCTWNATTNDAFINITSGSGNGSGTVTYTVQASSGSARTGTISVADKTFTVNQGGPCSYSLSPPSANVSAAGGSGSFGVASDAGCAWSAISNDSWIHITSGGNGTGVGTVSYSVDANVGPARSGSITVAGQTFTITQSNGCTFILTPTSVDVSAAGGNGSFNVTTAAGCVWIAASNDAWINVTSGGGSGSATVTFTVQANAGAPRMGSITAGGETFTINQAGNCAVSLPVTGADFPVNGGTGSFDVTAGAGCAWSAVSNASWIHITSGSSGSGNGTVGFSVDANLAGPRSGTISVGGQFFTVNQASSCTYSTVSSATSPFPPVGGDGTVTVNASVGCEWTATTIASWIIIHNGSGSGAGSFTFSVLPNSGPSRSGEILVGGQTVLVAQVEGCTFTLSPTQANVPASGGSVQFTVNTAPGCLWNAFSDFPWLSPVSSVDPEGHLIVIVAVEANSGGSRTGTVQVRGSIFTIFQAGFIPTRADFDGDGKTDVSIYRPSEGKWYLIKSQLGYNVVEWGSPTDIPTPADFDHDSKTDVAIYRPETGQWFIMRSSDNTFLIADWGNSTDKPVAADYDGDGSADIAVYRPQTGEWLILKSSDGSAMDTQWGESTDLPVPGYYDADKKADLAVFRPSSGTWYLLQSTGGGISVNWGAAQDKPVQADYDGDTRDDIAVYRPSEGNWYILNSSTSSGGVVNWGEPTDIPVPGDYDGNGRYDIAQFRPSTGQWRILVNSTAIVTNWGTATDKPIPAAYLP